MHFDQELDTRNLKCFMLTLRTKKTLNAMDSGMVLKVTAAGPGAVAEFTAYTKQTAITSFISARNKEQRNECHHRHRISPLG